jgi:hypothetical protein
VAAGGEADPTLTVSTIPGMPFPEPETALASTIAGTHEEKPHLRIYRASCGILEGVYLFLITCTKSQ